MAEIGDRVRMSATRVGQAPRQGVVTAVSGGLLGIRWSTGEESTLVPGPGTLTVIGKTRASSGKKAATPTKGTKARKATPTARKAGKKSGR